MLQLPAGAFAEIKFNTLCGIHGSRKLTSSLGNQHLPLLQLNYLWPCKKDFHMPPELAKQILRGIYFIIPIPDEISPTGYRYFTYYAKNVSRNRFTIRCRRENTCKARGYTVRCVSTFDRNQKIFYDPENWEISKANRMYREQPRPKYFEHTCVGSRTIQDAQTRARSKSLREENQCKQAYVILNISKVVENETVAVPLPFKM